MQKANLSKVTLEAQVRLLDPDELVRPEMLAQVRFFGGGDDGAEAVYEAAGGLAGEALWIPERVHADGHVWVVDADGSAARRKVEIGRSAEGELEVLEGLNLTDKVVDSGRQGLSEGARVRIGGTQ